MPDTDLTFTTPSGQTIGRELLICCLNTSTDSSPAWSPIGKRVESSDIEYDWSKESIQDILGLSWTTLKKPVKTQSYDPLPLDSGDAASVKLWNLGVRQEDAQALASQDMLIIHKYATGMFAERYSACAVTPTRMGGDGGGNLTTGYDVTYGGERTLGNVSISDTGVITFTADAA